jgi:hypothetical protein
VQSASRDQFGYVRLMVAIMFGFIFLAVGAIHLHLMKTETTYAGNSEDTVSVHGVLRSRPEMKPMQQSSNGQASVSISSQRSPKSRGIGSKRGHITCDVNVDPFVSYWSDPRSDQDRDFQSPFLKSPDAADHIPTIHAPRYLSFEPDPGGW